MAPPNKAPPIKGKDAPDLSANEIAIGPKATIQPTEVPVAVDKKEAMTKIPKGKKEELIFSIPKFTTASTPPVTEVTVAKAPAKR